MALEKARKSDLIKDYRRHESDSGSSEVQIAILTERIRHLTEHLKGAPKDHSTRRGLLQMVGKRAALLRYLAHHDAPRYQSVIGRLGIRR
jgi:small subunit ribosomal protein S15